MSIATKKAIFALRLQGLSNAEIGERVNLHPVSVSRIFSHVKKLETAGVIPEQLEEPPSDVEVLRGWKERLTTKSIKALDRGLDDTADNYRAGALGRDVLKGLGELQGDSVNVSIHVLLASVPPEWRERYWGASDDPGPRILPDEQHELWALEVFQKSGYSAAQFTQLRLDARADRMRLISNNEDFNEFFRAETARHSKSSRGS